MTTLPNIAAGNRQNNAEKVGVAILDRGCNYIYVNPQMATYHRRTVADYYKKHISELLPSEVLALVTPLYEYVLKTGLPIPCVEFHTQTPDYDGGLIHWRASYVPISLGIRATIIPMCGIQVKSASEHRTAEWTSLNKLSPTEYSIVELLARGLSTKEIAAILNVSIFTVATHRKNICRKLNLHSASELVAFAAQALSTQLPPAP